MRIAAISLAFALWMLPVSGNAQFSMEMASVRCEQYLAMPLDQSRDFSAWMSGWFSYKIGKTWVDLVAYKKNIANVKAWCTYHPKDTVMSGLELAAKSN
jgi:HdeA/HdeB family